jgi:hypothetical protein
MKKIIIAILITILVMLQIFYYVLVNAKATFGYNSSGGQVVSIDLGIQQFNYWEVQYGLLRFMSQ